MSRRCDEIVALNEGLAEASVLTLAGQPVDPDRWCDECGLNEHDCTCGRLSVGDAMLGVRINAMTVAERIALDSLNRSRGWAR